MFKSVGDVDGWNVESPPLIMPSSVSHNSDIESSAPTVVDEPKSRDGGAVDQVIAPGEESPQDVQQEKADPFLVQWDGPNDAANPKVSRMPRR
jgi:hypothetical protein